MQVPRFPRFSLVISTLVGFSCVPVCRKVLARCWELAFGGESNFLDWIIKLATLLVQFKGTVRPDWISLRVYHCTKILVRSSNRYMFVWKSFFLLIYLIKICQKEAQAVLLAHNSNCPPNLKCMVCTFLETYVSEKRTTCAHTSHPPKNWVIRGNFVLRSLVLWTQDQKWKLNKFKTYLQR